MLRLDAKELEEAAEACANEPIHTPDLIQPHGYLISLCQDSHCVLRASDNLNEILGRPARELLETPAENFLAEEFIHKISLQARSGPANSSSSVPIEMNEKSFIAAAHSIDNELVIEFEPSTEDTIKSEQNIFHNFDSYCSEILKCEDYSSLFNTFASFIRKVSGFDRVKVYQFDEDWNGQVISEDKQEDMQSYMGLSFPASDIPKQARELYKRNLLRQIVSSDYQAVPVLTASSKRLTPFDMSYSVLRSVSPVHLKYLANMGVGGSMSISILNDNELWGLVVCHHNTAKFVSYKVRALCEIMSHIFSARHILLDKDVARREQRELRQVIANLSSPNITEHDGDLFNGVEDSSLKLLNADGLVIFNRSKRRTFGSLPSDDDIEALGVWYLREKGGEIFKTSDVGAVMCKSGFSVDLNGGALLLPIGYQRDSFACWFRAPQASKVKWAGNPDKSANLDKEGRLTPRNSFELWKADVKQKSVPWEEKCLRAAECFVSVIQETEKQRVEAKNAAKSDFLSHMSHELRTPLTAISSIAQILDEEGDFPADKQQLIESLKISSRSLMSLVNDLLDLNKIEAGAIELEATEFRCEELMEEVRSVMGVEASKKGLSFNINYGSGKELGLIGDVTKLRQILFNLVGNALKFTPSGFINVFCNVKKSILQRGKAEVCIDVSDTGVGIADNKIELIFEKFTQADSSITEHYGGSGLGLSISRSLLEAMQGEISVTSKQGMGTKFSIKVNLPINKDSMNIKSAISFQTIDKLTQENNNKRILLAEDYQGNIVAILHYLQSKGFNVSIANNGEEATEKALAQDFDVILMDIQMPILDGISATRLIRKSHNNIGKKCVPIIGMTASAMKEDKQRCLDAGMTDYISKPLKLEELLDKIKQQL